MDLPWLWVSLYSDIWQPIFFLLLHGGFFKISPRTIRLLQQSDRRQPLALLFYLFFSFFLHLLVNEGKLPLAGTLPPVEMAFLVRCYANCLQPWSSKVSDVVIPFSGQCLWLRMLLLPGCVCVCVCYWEGEIGWGWEIDLYAYDEYLLCLFRNAFMLSFFL